MKEKNCNDCANFYTCDPETACLASECKNISEAEVEALLAREDVDRDYGDIYFFAMLPYNTIRGALEYHRNTD